MVDLPSLWWTVQVVTHIAYLIPLFIAYRLGRIITATSIFLMIITSIHYHVCLGTDVCLGNLAHAAAADWCGAGLVTVALAVQLCAYPAAVSMSLMILYMWAMSIMYPLLADEIAPTVLLMIIILTATYLRTTLFLTPAPYAGGLLGYVGIVITLISFGLFVFPRGSVDPLYNTTHSLWHIMSAFGITVVILIEAREALKLTRTWPYLHLIQYFSGGEVDKSWMYEI